MPDGVDCRFVVRDLVDGGCGVRDKDIGHVSLVI